MTSFDDDTTEALSDDPLEHLDDYERPAELRRAHRLTSPLTWVLVSAVIAVGTFAIGAKVGSDHATSSAADLSSGTAAAIAARGGLGASCTGSRGRSAAGGGAFGSAAGAGSGGTAGSGATIGQIQLVDGTNLYVSTFNGGVVKVTTNPATTVMALESGTLADLKVGSTVVVQGSAGAGGSVAASAISQGGARAGGPNSAG